MLCLFCICVNTLISCDFLGKLFKIQRHLNKGLIGKIVGIVGGKDYISGNYPVFVFDLKQKILVSANDLDFPEWTINEEQQYKSLINKLLGKELLLQVCMYVYV